MGGGRGEVATSSLAVALNFIALYCSCIKHNIFIITILRGKLNKVPLIIMLLTQCFVINVIGELFVCLIDF